MSKGRQPDAASLTALAAWSGINPVEFTTAPKSNPEPLVMVSRLLRQDPELDDVGANALDAIIKTAYDSLKRRADRGLAVGFVPRLHRPGCHETRLRRQRLALPDPPFDFGNGLLHPPQNNLHDLMILEFAVCPACPGCFTPGFPIAPPRSL